jgi:hypothetical protein
MIELLDAFCKACGRAMNNVADIPPRSGEPGLRAFICDSCGTVESVLVYPSNQPTVQQQQSQPKGDDDTR